MNSYDELHKLGYATIYDNYTVEDVWGKPYCSPETVEDLFMYFNKDGVNLSSGFYSKELIKAILLRIEEKEKITNGQL